MIITKNIKEIDKNFEFLDSIVIKTTWSEDMLDLLVELDYFWDIQEGKEEARLITLRLKNCFDASFKLPHFFHTVKSEERKSYLNSWYTITSVEITEVSDKNYVCQIRTADEESLWLDAKCEEIWLEGSEDSD